jgi:hypothetical protein
VVAKGRVTTRQRQHSPHAARAERLTDQRGGLLATLDTSRTDAQTDAVCRGSANGVETALLDECIDAGAADAQAVCGLRGGQPLIFKPS